VLGERAWSGHPGDGAAGASSGEAQHLDVEATSAIGQSGPSTRSYTPGAVGTSLGAVEACLERVVSSPLAIDLLRVRCVTLGGAGASSFPTRCRD
jgi:hypothetical protein